MRKFYVKQLVLALLLLMGFTAAAQQTWNCGKVNETDLTATLENGTLTISGKGAMKDYDWDSPWGSSLSSITKVVIKEGVTSIGSFAFNQCRELTEVVIPNSVTSVGDDAFYSTALTQVIIPNGVTSIGEYAFEGCESLKQVAILSSVTNINKFAFLRCPELINITVSESNVNYSSENGVLFNKNKTELVCCPGGKLGDYTIPSSVTSIGLGAFASCEKLMLVTIPNSVTTIGVGAFAESSLIEITIPSSVTSIGLGAFSECNQLTEVFIPSSVTIIDKFAFEDCSVLTNIKVSESNVNYVSENGVLFNKDKTKLMCYPGGKLGDYAIPSSVVSIEGVFGTGLTGITIPSSVNSIGDYAFTGCSILTKVTILGSVKSFGYEAFDYCESLQSFTILNPDPASIEMEIANSPHGSPFIEVNNCKLIVPATSIAAYKIAWAKYIGEGKAFTSVEGYGSTLYNIELTGTGGTVSGSGSCAEGSNHTVTAVANEGYAFVNWIENGAVVSRNANYTFAVHQNRTLQAVFVENANSTVDVSDVEIPADKGVAVTVEAENAVVAWTAKANAAGYTLVIKDAAGANIICSLEFDGEGRLSALSFGAALRSTGNTFGFKVTNLEQNTTYSYTLQALDADNNVIDTKQGEFTTKSGEQTAIPSIDAVPATIVGYYNLMGQRLNAEPTHGIYIILYSNGTSQKVFSSK